MTARVHRLRNRLMLAFAVFALAVASLFGLYVAVFVYSVEDRFFDAMLEQEAQQQLDQRAASGSWSPPRMARSGRRTMNTPRPPASGSAAATPYT